MRYYDRRYIRRIARSFLLSEFKFDDALTLIGCLFRREHFLLLCSPKMIYRQQGTMVIDGVLILGYQTSMMGLDPRGGGYFLVGKQGSVNIDGYVRIARTCKFRVTSHLTIGDGTYIQPGTSVYVDGQGVEIGKNCAIAWDCVIMSGDHHRIIENGMVKPVGLKVTIGDHVWIGAKSIILKNTHIGDGAIIAAGSVVTKDVPAHCLAAGVPARVIRKNIDWGNTKDLIGQQQALPADN